jgi:O-antigen/teichoic acid export membrane protein
MLATIFVLPTTSAILTAYLGYLVIQLSWMAIYLFRTFGAFWEGFRWSTLATELSYGLPLGFAGLLWCLQLDIHNYFVAHYFNAALFAVYSIGCFDLPLINILGDSVGSILIPRISALQAAGSTGEIIFLMVRAMRGLAFAITPLFAFSFVAANQLITVLFRKQYLASVPIFRINLLVVLLGIFTVDPILRAFKAERFWFLKLNAVLFVFQLGSLYFGTTHFGLLGAIGSVVLFQYIVRVLLIWKMARLLKVTPADLRPLLDVAKILAAAACGALCVAALLDPLQSWPPAGKWGPHVSLFVCGILFCVLYAAGLLLLKAPHEAEVRWVRDWVSRRRPNLPI